VLSAGVLSFTVHISSIVVRIARPRWEKFMKLPHRRHFLHLAAGAAVLPALSRVARAENYPTRPVRVIAGFPAGGPVDIAARLAGQILSERLGQNFFIQNHPGAGGNVATELVVRAPADGYTLLAVGAPAAINTTLYSNLPFNFLDDIAPVAGVMNVPYVMEVTPLFPAKTVPEFIAYAKANPGKINFGSGGNGTGQQIAGEMFNMMTGVSMVHVPYRGGALALVDLMAGQVQMMIDTISSSIEFIKAGKLRALAMASTARSEALPDLSTVGDFVPGYEMSTWFGLCAPKNTPATVIDTLNKTINSGLADPATKKRVADLGGTPLPGAPGDFGKHIAEDTEKWGKVIRATGIKAE
jgi:tripartite-type tricarboxylate transporter receptor subunit TctC